MEDLLTCTVCCEQYHEKHRHPVLLPRCGHSFCRPCVAFLVKNGCVICPSCRMDQRVETAEHLPTEFSLLAITSVQQVTRMETCERHQVKLSFWCRTCSEAACGECLFEDHPTHSHKVLKATTYIGEMKDSVSAIASKFVEALDLRERWYHQQVFRCTKTINDAIRTLSVLRRDLEDARELMKGVNVVEGIAPTTTLCDAAKCLGLKWNLKDCNLLFSRAAAKKEETTAQEEKEKDESETKNKTDDSKNNEEKEIKVNEKEREIDESETLTEEEKRKRKKMLRIKEKLAAAAAAAERVSAASVHEDDEGKKNDKPCEKEKTDDAKEKSNHTNEQPPLAIGAAKTKLLAKKYAPTPREPSVTPEREVQHPPREPSVTPEREVQHPHNNPPSPSQEKENKDEKNKEASDNKDIDTKPEDETRSKQEAATETQPEPSRTQPEKESNQKSLTDSLHEATSQKGPSKEKKELGAIKKPRGRLARQALKRSQTMNLAPLNDDNTSGDLVKDNQSDNIKGLDLETVKLNKNEEPSVDNKDIEDQANTETLETQEKVEEGEEKRDENEQQESGNKAEDAATPMFEMEPEEKERIATELMLVPSLTVVVEGTGGRLAHLTWETMGLHVYCHQYQELPYDVIIKSNVVHSLVPTKTPVVFLDVGTEHKLLGRVYINLWGHLRRATNFLHLCLGDRGPSYKNTMFLEVLNADCPGERIKGGDFDYNNGRGGEALLEDLESQEGYSMSMEAGMVTAGTPCRREQDSQFFICTEDDPDRNFACPFGRVVSGLYVMKEAVWLVVTKQVWIRDCGVVLDVPKF
nr:uncharacterized protein LOC123757498 isoform X2 [Procambarus clarkii]